MADAVVKSPLRWVWRALVFAGVLIGLVGLVVGVAVVMLKGAYGATLVRDFADGREIAGYGELEVGPIRGDVLGDFRIDHIRVRDGEGVWLEAEDIAVQWSPLDLIGRTLAIRVLSMDTVTVSRRPERAQQDDAPSGGGPDLSAWRLDLGQAQFDMISLGEGVAGPAVELTAGAALTRDATAWRGRLDVERRDAPGDQIAAEFSLGDQLDATFDLSAAAEGPLTALLGLSGTALRASGAVRGDVRAGDGDARLLAAGTEAGQLEMRWSDGRLLVSGSADFSALPLLEAAAQRLSGPVSIVAEAPYGAAGLSALSIVGAELALSSGPLSLNVRPAGEQRLDIDAELGEGALALLSGGALQARAASVNGRLDLSGDRSFAGRISAQGFAGAGDITLAAVSGDVTAAGPLDAPTVSIDFDTQGLDTGIDPVGALLGAAPGIEAEAVWRRDAGRIEVARWRVDAPAGALTGRGVLDLNAQRWSVVARSDRLDVSALTDLVAGAGGVSLEAEGGFDGAVSASTQFERFAPAGALAEQLTAPLAGQAAITRTPDGALLIDSATLTSPELRVEASGAQSVEGWALQGDAVWSGAAPVSALRLDGALTASFDVETRGEAVTARVEARAASLEIGPEQITSPRLRLEADGALDTLSGAVRLDGEGLRGPVDLTAEFVRAGDGVELSALTGQASGFLINASGAAGPAALALQAALRPVAGFGELSLEAELAEGQVTARLEAQDLVFADMAYLDAGEISIDGALEDAALSYSLEGAYGAPFEVAGSGRLGLAGDEGSTLSVSADGSYGVIEISTRAPLSVRTAPALQVAADLSVGRGRVQLELDAGEPMTVQARLSEAPASLLSLREAREPVEGSLSGEARFTREAGVWTGSARLAGEDLRPADALDARTLAGEVRLTLDREGVRLEADATGDALSADAELTIASGPVSAAADLTRPDAVVGGALRAEGRIGDLAAFHLDPAQRLEGEVSLDAAVSGTVGDPVLTGAGALTQGRFRDGRAGLDLQALVVELDFTRQGARLTRLEASDGQGGELTGQGRIVLANAFEIDASLAFDRFRLLNRTDMQAVGSGDVAFVLRDGQGRVSGAAVIDRADIRPPDAGRASIPEIEVTEINRPAGLDPAPVRRAGPPIALDYTVRAPRRVFVRGPNFDTEWSFDLAIKGTADAPELSGEAEVVRGRADLLGRNFELERGEVILEGDLGDSRIDVLAVNAQSDVTARVRVTGTVSAPEVSLSSDPALPQDEVASRILFGESVSNLSALQAAQLAGALASLSGGGSAFDPLGTLREVARLDVLGVRRNAAGATVLSGGRYLTEDVFLQVEGSSLGAAPSTQIDWTLTPRFTLSSRLDAQGRAGLALSWRIEYDRDPFSWIDLFRGFRDRVAGDEDPADDDTAGP